MKLKTYILFSSLVTTNVFADITVKKVSSKIVDSYSDDSLWSAAEPNQGVSLMAQPMVAPRPKSTETSIVQVTAVHDGEWIAFRVKWKDTEISDRGRLATYSDAVALQFPVKDNENPPPVMMGIKGDPVQIFHWKYEYQIDAEQGKKTVGDIYPNMNYDMYPMDYKEKGNYKEATQEQKESFVGGTAAGNPQSFKKTGVDEIFAEGFGTSALSPINKAKGKGIWKDGEWTVYLARPLIYEEGSKLAVGRKSNIAFAVWQGGKKETGARKSLTMLWTPIIISEK